MKWRAILRQLPGWRGSLGGAAQPENAGAAESMLGVSLQRGNTRDACLGT